MCLEFRFRIIVIFADVGEVSKENKNFKMLRNAEFCETNILMIFVKSEVKRLG